MSELCSERRKRVERERKLLVTLSFSRLLTLVLFPRRRSEWLQSGGQDNPAVGLLRYVCGERAPIPSISPGASPPHQSPHRLTCCNDPGKSSRAIMRLLFSSVRRISPDVCCRSQAGCQNCPHPLLSRCAMRTLCRDICRLCSERLGDLGDSAEVSSLLYLVCNAAEIAQHRNGISAPRR